MAKKGAKDTMPTCTVLMHSNLTKPLQARYPGKQRFYALSNAFVFIELILAITIISMITALSLIAFSAAFGKTKFQKQADSFINTLKMARTAAAESDKRYAVILDFDEGTYTFREYVTLAMDVLPYEQAILKTGLFTEQCQLDYVTFDDLTDTRDWNLEEVEYFRVVFFAGHSGWQNGGKIVLRDIDGNPYSVIVNRLTPVINLYAGDVEMLLPQQNLRF
jgi:Tfp pilus assembly protein FimT